MLYLIRRELSILKIFNLLYILTSGYRQVPQHWSYDEIFTVLWSIKALYTSQWKAGEGGGGGVSQEPMKEPI